jgi:hypothetical protein
MRNSETSICAIRIQKGVSHILRYCPKLSIVQPYLSVHCLSVLSDFRIPHSAFRLPHSHFRISTSPFRLPHSEFPLPHSAFRLLHSFYPLPLSIYHLFSFLLLQSPIRNPKSAIESRPILRRAEKRPPGVFGQLPECAGCKWVAFHGIQDNIDRCTG